MVLLTIFFVCLAIVKAFRAIADASAAGNRLRGYLGRLIFFRGIVVGCVVSRFLKTRKCSTGPTTNFFSQT